MTQHNAADLITTSRQTTSIEHVTCASHSDAEALASELQAAWDGEADSVDTGDRIEVWGWQESTPANEQDWRVHITW